MDMSTVVAEAKVQVYYEVWSLLACQLPQRTPSLTFKRSEMWEVRQLRHRNGPNISIENVRLRQGMQKKQNKKKNL